MIRDYSQFVAQRWSELGVQQKSVGDAEAIKNVQSGAILQIARELHWTTLFEGRKHPEVGLLFKDWGNHFHDPASGIDMATDIICVRSTDTNGREDDVSVMAICDCVVNIGSPDARPSWGVELAQGADITRWRQPPEIAEVPIEPPVDPPVDPPVNGG
jgi:hypothetical protein